LAWRVFFFFENLALWQERCLSFKKRGTNKDYKVAVTEKTEQTPLKQQRTKSKLLSAHLLHRLAA
jgi:hypothetical protein